ncbi:energy transducer TonB [Synechococcus sp. W65.1]|uniref:energy transducer TonB n=1 Tax=Synechococcus sp. W65.1 TaxID=2964526 RepID=UPI0039C0CF7D
MLAEPPARTPKGSLSLLRKSCPQLLWRLQGWYWQQAGMAWEAGLAWLALWLWAGARESGWLECAEELLQEAWVAGYSWAALWTACQEGEEPPGTVLHLRARDPRPLRWEGLISLLLHLMALLGLAWWGSRPLSDAELRIPVTLLLEDPEPQLLEPDSESIESLPPEPTAEPPGPAPESPPADDLSPPEPVPQEIEMPAIPEAESLLALQTPTPTPPPTPTPIPTAKPEPTPTPPLTPLPTATPQPTPPPQQPTPTPAVTPTSTATPLTSAPVTSSTPLPRFTPLIQGIRSSVKTAAAPPSPGSESRLGPRDPETGTPGGIGAAQPHSSAPTPATPSSSPPTVAANPQPDILARPIPGRNPPPPYPPQARRLGQQGQVLLRAKVNAQGQVQQVEIASSSGFPALDRAAQEAVQRWEFSPALRNNVPIESWVVVPIQFTLN